MRHFAAVKFVILPTCILLLSFAALAQSNSGKLVYSDEPGRIRIINADGTGDTELTAGLFIIDDDPVYSPDGSKIAFTRRGSSKSEICIMNADGTNVVSLIPGSVPPQTNDWDPSWSPDGSKLVFSSNRSGAGKAEIWMANADGTGLHRLTTSIQVSSDGQGAIFSMDLDAAWSPDGSKIAFVSTRDGLTDSELYLMNPDGTNALRLTDDALDDHMPAWSPDSQKIALAKGNGVGIVIMNRDGTNLVNIAPSSAWPAWSPDGTRLAFMQLDPNNNFNGNIFITKTDGTNKVRVTNNPSGARSASWAPSSSPAIPNFTIAGVVKDTTGLPISGATLTMFTVPVRNAQSDATGAYSFAGLPAGTYRIDIAKPGFGFVTTTVTVTIVSADQVANFTGFVAFSISGTIDGAGSGVPVTLTGSESRSTLTEGAGVYSFNFLPAGGNYTVSINSPFFIITPLSITFNNLSANQTANFSAVRAKYTISGTTRRLGLPKPGITVQLRDTTGFAPLSTTSDANGHYAFTDVIAGRAYSVELASANYLADSKGIAALDSDKIVDFDLRSANNIGFSNTSFTVIEGTPSLQITVFRGGNAAGVGPITVDYATADGTATAGSDYTAVSGTLQFPEGAFSRTITIPILNDQLSEGPEQFSLILSNPTGEVDLATNNTATITIADGGVRLITQDGNDRTVALNATSLVAEPFALTTEQNFSADSRTRISLFVEDLRIFQTFPTIIVDAVDAQQNHFQLPLETVGFFSNFPFQQLIVRLPTNLSSGELLVTVTVNGTVSNAARISIKP